MNYESQLLDYSIILTFLMGMVITQNLTIIIIKSDVVTIICNIITIQCDIGIIKFFYILNLNK
jgi:hypothetical protein